YDSFLFEIEPDQGELTSVVMKDNLGEPRVHVPNVLPTHPTLMMDSDFIPSDDSLGSDLGVSFPSGTRNKIFYPGIFEVQPKIFLIEDLVPIPSESEGISYDTCDVPFCDNSPPIDVLNNHFEIFSDFNDDCTSSDDDSFEDIDYVETSPPDSEPVSLEEVKDEIFCEKLLNFNLLIAKIESLNDNPLLIVCSSLLPHFLSPLRIVT
nr:hypothetical protein [Tanacetum cinerariifolium]